MDFGTLQLYASDGSVIPVPGKFVFSLANTGTARLSISGVAIANTRGCANSFRLAGPLALKGGLEPGLSADLTVNFVPDSSCLSLSSATITVSSNDGFKSPYSFDVSAMAGYGRLKFVGDTDFNVDLGDGAGASETQTLVLTVEGNLGVELLAVSLNETGGWSFVDLDSALSSVLVPGEETRFLVTFRPTTTGTFATDLDFSTDSARDARTFSIPLGGRVAAPRLVIQGEDGFVIPKGGAVDFGTLQLYASDGSVIPVPGKFVFSLANARP